MCICLDHNFVIYKIRRLNCMNSITAKSQKQGFVSVSDNKSNVASHKIIKTIQKIIKRKTKFFQDPTICN